MQIVRKKQIITFWFGTLGAGVCLSRTTMHKIKAHAKYLVTTNKKFFKQIISINISPNKFLKGCNEMLLPDDMYLGYLLGNLILKSL